MPPTAKLLACLPLAAWCLPVAQAQPAGPPSAATVTLDTSPAG